MTTKKNYQKKEIKFIFNPFFYKKEYKALQNRAHLFENHKLGQQKNH